MPIIIIIIGDWNEECKGTSNSQKLCDKFGLVDVWDRLYPNESLFKTYLHGSRRIDFALALPETADCITNIAHEPFTNDYRAIIAGSVLMSTRNIYNLFIYEENLTTT